MRTNFKNYKAVKTLPKFETYATYRANLRKLSARVFLVKHVGLHEKEGTLHRGVIKLNAKYHPNSAFIEAVKSLEMEMIDKYNMECVEAPWEEELKLPQLPSLVPADQDPRVVAGTHKVIVLTVDSGGKGCTIKVPEIVQIDD